MSILGRLGRGAPLPSGLRSGLIGRLLVLAAEEVGAGEATMDYGSRLLGISLHAIQDYFSHYVPVSVGGGQDLRRLYGNQREFWILEDDPLVDSRERWRAAQTYSQHQLWNFRTRLKRDFPPVVWKAEANATAAAR